ncbi:hypothetical protein Tco_0509103 [Tanacetum coccineum]
MCARAVTIIPGLLRRINNNQETLNVQATQAQRLKFVLCYAVNNKVELIEEIKQLDGTAIDSDHMAFVRILCGEDLDKAKSIMKLINETQEHTRKKYTFIAKVKLDHK